MERAERKARGTRRRTVRLALSRWRDINAEERRRMATADRLLSSLLRRRVNGAFRAWRIIIMRRAVVTRALGKLRGRAAAAAWAKWTTAVHSSSEHAAVGLLQVEST